MASKKKIIIFNGFLINGYAHFNRLIAYAKGFYSQGYEPLIVSFKNMDLGGFMPEKNISIIGLLPTRIKNRYLKYVFSFLSLSFFVLTKLSDEDIIILYGDGEYLPLLVKLRRGNIYHEITENPEVVGLHRISVSRYYRYCSRTRGMFVISRSLKTLLIQNGIAEKKISIINMIVDSSRFSSEPSILPFGNYIAYCGIIRSDEKDAISFMLNVFQEYHESFPDRKLLIIGPIFSKELQSRYESIIDSLGLNDCVVLMGKVLPKDMPKYLMSAEMLLMTRQATTQTQYGFSTKLGEFLCSGRPVITSAVGDVSLFLKDGDNALLARPGNINDFVERMNWVSKNPELATRIGMNGKQCALISFNYLTETKKIISCFCSDS